MGERLEDEDRVVTSVTDLTVGDGLYADSSESVYWVVEITATSVVLETSDGKSHRWIRETLEASFGAHLWIQQSTAATVERGSFGGASEQT